jgi:hypothetical protein
VAAAAAAAGPSKVEAAPSQALSGSLSRQHRPGWIAGRAGLPSPGQEVLARPCGRLRRRRVPNVQV